MIEDLKMTENLSAELPDMTPDVDPLDEPLEVSPEEIIDAFEAVYEELVMLRNSVIHLHERLEKLESLASTVLSNVSV